MRKRSFRRRLCLMALTLLCCAACALVREDPAPLAAQAGLSPQVVQTSLFRIYALSRKREPGQPWVVYIEGDGLAWLSRTRPSSDPTPRTATGLRLAVLDSAPNLLYLARPCQFISHDPLCRSYYWTEGRFSQEVVNSLNQAITQIAGKDGVHLVGYSGGGAVATLLAARRDDALSLRTMAGPLDTQRAMALQGVSPLAGSLNPADGAQRLTRLPQQHFSGARDTLIPPEVSQSYAHRMGQTACLTLTTLPTATHVQGWESFWTQQHAHFPSCKNTN